MTTQEINQFAEVNGFNLHPNMVALAAEKAKTERFNFDEDTVLMYDGLIGDYVPATVHLLAVFKGETIPLGEKEIMHLL